MNKIHKSLLKDSPAYKKWHANPQSTPIHWAIFCALSLLSATLILQNTVPMSQAQVVDMTPPSAPTNLVAWLDNISPTLPNYGHINIAWAPSTDDVGVVGYKIYRDGNVMTTPGQMVYQTGMYLATVTGTTYSDYTAFLGTYTYYVVAVDAAGNQSPMSAPVSLTIPPHSLVITSFNVTNITSSSATVNWTTAIPANGTLVYSASSNRFTDSVGVYNMATSNSVTLNNLRPGKTYYYYIIASIPNGSGFQTLVNTWTTLGSGGTTSGGKK